jgi:hypothetical protein
LYQALIIRGQQGILLQHIEKIDIILLVWGLSPVGQVWTGFFYALKEGNGYRGCNKSGQKIQLFMQLTEKS